MKRWLMGFSIAALLLAYSSPAAAMSESFVSLDGLKEMESLDIETALELVLEDSTNIMLLELQADALDSMRTDVNKQENNLADAAIGYDLPDSTDEIIGEGEATEEQQIWLGRTIETNTVLNQTITVTNATIHSQRNELKATVKQLYTDKQNTLLGLEEAKEGAKLQTTALYVQLLSIQKQIAIAEDYLSILEEELARSQALASVGMATEKDIVEGERPIRDQKEQILALNDQYQLLLVQFSFDLGIVYNPMLELKDFTVTPQIVERQDTERLLSNSFELQRQWNDVEQAKWEEQNTDISTEDGEDYLETSTDIARNQAEQVKSELAESISKTYTNADAAYRQFQASQQNETDAIIDYNYAAIHYENGLMTSYDLNKVKFLVRQAETATALAKLQYYVSASQVEAMENGLI